MAVTEATTAGLETYMVIDNKLIVSREDRLIKIEAPPQAFGFESWDGVRVLDFTNTGYRTVLYKGSTVLHLVLVGPNGSIVFLEYGENTNISAQSYDNVGCYITQICSPSAYRDCGVQPRILDPAATFLREDILLIASQCIDDVDALWRRINELRDSAGVC